MHRQPTVSKPHLSIDMSLKGRVIITMRTENHFSGGEARPCPVSAKYPAGINELS